MCITLLFLLAIAFKVSADINAYDHRRDEGVYIEEELYPVEEWEEVPVYNEKEGNYDYETVIYRDRELIETYNPEKGLYKTYYKDN